MELKLSSPFAAVTAGVTLQAEAVEQSWLTFTSGGKTIPVEAFEPEAGAAFPAIVVLHGAGGMDYGNAYVRQLAMAFATKGYGTYLVHYFKRTGDSHAGDAAIHANFATWIETVSDAVGFVAQRPRADSDRLATFGYSLGGYLALAHAAQDPRVRAVVELAGGIDPSYAGKVKRMPPALIMHGKSDRRVEPARAAEVAQLLKNLGVPHQVELYEGEGHVLSPLASLDALSKGLAFLNEHVR